MIPIDYIKYQLHGIWEKLISHNAIFLLKSSFFLTDEPYYELNYYFLIFVNYDSLQLLIVKYERESTIEHTYKKSACDYWLI